MAPGRDPRGGDCGRRARALLTGAATGMLGVVGDGALVAFDDYELRQIRVFDRAADQIRSIDVPRVRAAYISRDGRHLALEASGGDRAPARGG